MTLLTSCNNNNLLIIFFKHTHSNQQVSIFLKDVNDESPRFISANETTVMENAPLNSVLHTVKAVDGDEGRNGYVEYLLNNEKSTFSLGAVDGLLRVIGNIDREIKGSYTLKVEWKKYVWQKT